MWTKKNHFIWIDIKKNGKRVFAFPMALIIIGALFEAIAEGLAMLSVLVPKAELGKKKGKVVITVKNVELIFETIEGLMAILEYEHHLELVEISSKEAEVRIVLR